MNKPRVYLSGGFKTNWQQDVISRLHEYCIFINPREHRLVDPREYTIWDLHYLDHCDVVFAYMEESNPSGYGLALEVGYAKARGKTIILIDSRSKSDKIFANYFGIVRESAGIVFYEFEKGVSFLKTLTSCQ